MNNLERIAALVGETGKAQAGRTVSIRQGRQTVVGLVGVMTAQTYEVMGPENYLTEVVFYDWVFVRADLEAKGLTLDKGAIVIEGSREYQAAPVGKLPEIEDADTSAVMVKLHTRRKK